LFLSAVLTIRSTLSRSSSFDFIAAVKSDWMRSRNVIGKKDLRDHYNTEALHIFCIADRQNFSPQNFDTAARRQ
jgi:hypothetical protein